MTSAAAAVEARDLSKEFDGRTVVDRITFAVPRGTTFGLLGANGAGKTTTILMLLGLLRPDRGEARVLGHDMERDRFRALQRANFSSPYVSLPNRLTARQNLTVYGRLYGVSDVRRRIEYIARELRIEDLLDRPVGKMSAGQKTRVGIGKVLLNQPEVLFLDEPTASLSPESAAWLRAFLGSYRDRTGATVVLASHNMPEVEAMCDSVAFLQQGRLLEQGTPGDLIRRHGMRTLEQVFLEVADAAADRPGGSGSGG
ncbi:MAG: ABC transporter ATP-binding protein [Alphaproteobacteria bacterium]|nr:ABC transporter ATP-binding protein [Alphaproteobacteria bacterium]